MKCNLLAHRVGGLLFLIQSFYAIATNDGFQPYLYADVYARSEPISIMDTLHKWHGEHQRGEKQYAYSWLETGAKWNNWGFGVLYRADYALNFSGDAAELYGALANDGSLTTGKTYDVSLKAHAFQAKGLRVSWEQNFPHNINTTIGVSLLKGTYLLEGSLNGTAYATSDDNYEYDANVNYTYSKDILFGRVVNDQPTGYGEAIDFALDWQINQQWAFHSEVKDLFASIWWKDAPYTEAIAYSDRQHTSESGYTTWDPLISGYERTHEYFRQNLPTRLDTAVFYQLHPNWQLGTGVQYQFEDIVPRVGYGWQEPNCGIFVWYRPLEKSLEINTRWRKLTLGFGTNSLNWDNATAIHMRIAYTY